MTAAELEKLLAEATLIRSAEVYAKVMASFPGPPIVEFLCRENASLVRKVIAAEKLVEAAKALKERCASGEFYSDYDGDWKLVGDVSSALAAYEAAQ